MVRQGARPTDVHVWAVPLDDGRWERDMECLSSDELRRGERFVRDDLRRSFLAARVALRRCLGSYLNVAPSALRFQLGTCVSCGAAHGKPRLAWPPETGAEFNLSRSGSLAVVAAALNRPVGVDVEETRRSVEAETLAKRFFTAEERDVVMSAEPWTRQLAFYQLWTRKEAYLKGVGCGLTGGLDSIDVHGWAREVQVGPHGDAPEMWLVRDVDVPMGYAAAVASSGRDWGLAGEDAI